MDKKSIIIVVVSFALLVLLSRLTNYLWPPIPVPRNTNQVALQTNVTSSTQAVATLTNQPTISPSVAASFLSSNAPEHLVEIETPEARFVFTSRGGGLNVAELKNYPEVITCGKKSDAGTNRVHLNSAAPVPIMAVLGPE